MQNVTDAPVPSPAKARQIAVGQAIINLRVSHRVTVEVLVEWLRIDASTLSSWEAGEADLTLEQALSVEEQFGVARGSLAAYGRSVGHDVKPQVTEVFISSMVFDVASKAIEALTAASTVGLGARLRNQMSLVDEDGDTSMYEERWFLDRRQKFFPGPPHRRRRKGEAFPQVSTLWINRSPPVMVPQKISRETRSQGVHLVLLCWLRSTNVRSKWPRHTPGATASTSHAAPSSYFDAPRRPHPLRPAWPGRPLVGAGGRCRLRPRR